MFAVRHREFEELKRQDQMENYGVIQARKFATNCEIAEKNIALTLMNNDRKNYVDNFNDKYRARLTKENLDFK